MKTYTFENVLNSNIRIKIKANYYTQAMDLLLSATRHIEDYKLIDEPIVNSKELMVFAEKVNNYYNGGCGTVDELINKINT